MDLSGDRPSMDIIAGIDVESRSGATPHQPKPSLVLWIFIALGTSLTALNLQWPLARNALNYAKAAVVILQRHYDLFAVIRDQTSTGGKPILFSVLAAPFVWLTNATTGTLIASTLGGAFFLFATSLALPRLNVRAGLCSRLAPFEFTLVAFNPLVLYQFWSGYPDALFAGFVILAFVLIDLISNEPERDTRWHIVGLGATICAAILTKLYGIVLALLCPLYLLLHARQFLGRTTYRNEKLMLFAAALLAVAAMLISAKWNQNPLLQLDVGAGSNGYRADVITFKDALLMFAFCIVLTFNVILISLLWPHAWRRWPMAPALFALIYLLGLLPFSGSAYNMRYFLPAFPFVAPVLAAAAQSMPRPARTTLLVAYGIVAAILVLNFNVAGVQQALRPLSARLYNWQPNLGDWLDNLRLPVQIELKKQIETINRNLPLGKPLYWSSDYYGVVTHGLAHHIGVRRDIDVRYVLEPGQVPESQSPVFLTLFSSLVPPEEFWPVPRWATVRALGHGVFRLDPIAVRLQSVEGDFVATGEPIKLQVSVVTQTDMLVRDLQIVEGKNSWHSDLSRPSIVVLPTLVSGRHEFIARAIYREGDVATSSPIAVYVGVSALERRATLSGDLTVEFSDGSPIVPKDVLTLDEGDQAVGVRFEDIRVPQGARIEDAHLGFTAASPATGSTSLKIHAELSANAAAMDLTMGTVSSRVSTRTSSMWRMDPVISIGSQQISPNLAPLLEEVFSQSQWRSGNSVMLIIRVVGQTRSVEVANPSKAPRLYIKMR